MAKGAGMLAPGLATMLVVITTDAVLTADEADAHLRAATRVSFDRLDSDGCMSTNDQVTLMVSGASGVTPDADAFRAALVEVCTSLAGSCRRCRGREPRHHDPGRGRGIRGRRRRGGPLGRPQQPLQGRDLRQRPQLGPRARRDRHDAGGLRPVRRRRQLQRGALCSAAPRPPREEVDLTPRATDVLIDLKAGEARRRSSRTT
jgi:glutamate N-acetyltransferase/amino-acid N-acetyltransferase